MSPTEVVIVEMCRAGASRGQMWERLVDEFETEGDLAKYLNRMVGQGELRRETRKRPGAADEFVYVARVRAPFSTTAPDPWPAVEAPAIAPAPKPRPKNRETDMSKTTEKRLKYIEHLNRSGKWESPTDVAHALKVHPRNASYHLGAATAINQLQAIGRGNSRRFAAVGVAIPFESTPGKEPAREEPPILGRDVGKGAAVTAPAAPLPPIPFPNEPVDEAAIRCAIEDTGHFALHDGKNTIRLTRRSVHKIINFLTLTQHVWKDVA